MKQLLHLISFTIILLPTLLFSWTTDHRAKRRAAIEAINTEETTFSHIRNSQRGEVLIAYSSDIIDTIVQNPLFINSENSLINSTSIDSFINICIRGHNIPLLLNENQINRKDLFINNSTNFADSLSTENYEELKFKNRRYLILLYDIQHGSLEKLSVIKNNKLFTAISSTVVGVGTGNSGLVTAGTSMTGNAIGAIFKCSVIDLKNNNSVYSFSRYSLRSDPHKAFLSVLWEVLEDIYDK